MPFAVKGFECHIQPLILSAAEDGMKTEKHRGISLKQVFIQGPHRKMKPDRKRLVMLREGAFLFKKELIIPSQVRSANNVTFECFRLLEKKPARRKDRIC